MAHRVKNIKRFLVIRTNLRELSAIENCMCPGICDNCGPNRCFDGYIIPVLGHSWFCRKCLSDWLKRAKQYPEDVQFEKSVYNEYKARFAAKHLWHDAPDA